MCHLSCRLLNEFSIFVLNFRPLMFHKIISLIKCPNSIHAVSSPRSIQYFSILGRPGSHCWSLRRGLHSCFCSSFLAATHWLIFPVTAHINAWACNIFQSHLLSHLFLFAHIVIETDSTIRRYYVLYIIYIMSCTIKKHRTVA